MVGHERSGRICVRHRPGRQHAQLPWAARGCARSPGWPHGTGGSVGEHATYRGRRCFLSTNEYAEGVVAPEGYLNLAEFRLEGSIPVWTFAFADVLLERRLWMANGRNTSYVQFRLLQASESVELKITPLVTHRDHHVLTSGQGWQMHVESQPRGVIDQAFSGAAVLRLVSDRAEFQQNGRWYWNFRYREETARGLVDHGDLFAPGTFSARLEAGETVAFAYSVEVEVDLDGDGQLELERSREQSLIVGANARDLPLSLQQLVLAADQFVVGRGSDPTPAIIAGYPWFSDWGRDRRPACPACCSLPGASIRRGRCCSPSPPGCVMDCCPTASRSGRPRTRGQHDRRHAVVLSRHPGIRASFWRRHAGRRAAAETSGGD